MRSLILGKKKAPASVPATIKENPDLATIWIITTTLVGGVGFTICLFRGRFANLDSLATFLLAWGSMIGLVPIPLWSQVALAKLPPGVFGGTIKVLVGLCLTLYVICSFLFCLVAAEAITWNIFLGPLRLGLAGLEVIWQGNFGSPVR